MNLKIEPADLADGQSVDTVYARLRDAILRGEIEPGRELSQVQIAKALGVSRTPLREALRLLQREGLVEGKPNRRVRVAGFSVSDMEELYTLRITLEALAIRLTIPLATQEDIAALEGEMTQMAYFTERHDYDRYLVPHRAFHAGLVARSGTRLVQQLKELSDHGERYRHLHTTKALHAWEDAQKEHRAILDAFIAGDADLAASRLAEHLAHTVLGNLPLLAPDYEPTALRMALALAQHAEPRSK
jgi:DNA-binding GntR family transcriptional regulator